MGGLQTHDGLPDSYHIDMLLRHPSDRIPDQITDYTSAQPPAQIQDLPLTHEGMAVREAEYWDVWYDHPSAEQYEWVNGILEVKPVGDFKEFLLRQWFIRLLDEYLGAFPIGQALGMDFGFRLAFNGHISIRKPDYAVILNSNPVNIRDNDATYRGIYNLCIEFLSYSAKTEVERDTIHKKREYAGGGVQEYFILDARGLETAFYRLDRHQHYQIIQPEAGVIRSAVLPGFQFRCEDLYTRPHLKSLMVDPVYQGFVLLDYQTQMRQIDQERQRADKLAARLIALGVSPEEID